MERYILTIDQGTSGTKCLLVNADGRVVMRHDEAHEQFYPHPGWVEHDAMQIYENTRLGIQAVLEKANLTPHHIKSVAISNQRETAVVWNKHTGLPIANAVVWQCSRAAELCETLQKSGYEEEILLRSGLVLSPYYSAAKVAWLLEHVPGAKEAAERGDLLFGTIDSWLLYKLTQHSVHATDTSNASRTQLMNLAGLHWDERLLAFFKIPLCMMPEICPSGHLFGHVEDSVLQGAQVPIHALMGDSHAALFGQLCFEHGSAKATYGTGTSVMMNIGPTPHISRNGLVTSVGWSTKEETVYVAEGNINCSAATIKWLAEDLQLIENAAESERLARSVPGSEGVYFVPAFVGLGTPYWNAEATALITGLTRGSQKAHVVRAALEGIVLQVNDVLQLMQEETGTRLHRLKVDGGASRNRFLMQLQADVLQTDVLVNQTEEISALGAAFMAGLSCQFWQTRAELPSHYEDVAALQAKEARDALCTGWKKAVARCCFKPE